MKERAVSSVAHFLSVQAAVLAKNKTNKLPTVEGKEDDELTVPVMKAKQTGKGRVSFLD